ncbi:hypothetical protein BDR26DRAFT_824029, partial [Obelidium mucronatum]
MFNTIILAGCEDDKGFEKAEALAYHLCANLPEYSIEINLVPLKEWDSYKRSVYQENGWDNRRARDRKIKTLDELQQIIWRDSGELIGNTEDYIKLVGNFNNDQLLMSFLLVTSLSLFYLDETLLWGNSGSNRSISRDRLAVMPFKDQINDL